MNNYIGEIRLMAYPQVPAYWLPCEGQLIEIRTNPALFSLLGAMYGGDGINNFALPDLRGRVPVGTGPGPGLPPVTLGQPGGAETVALQGNQMPTHTHALQAVADLAGTANPAGALPAAKGRGGLGMFGAAGSANTTLSPATVSSAGMGQPHANLQPSLTVRACIAVQGVYPTPN